MDRKDKLRVKRIIAEHTQPDGSVLIEGQHGGSILMSKKCANRLIRKIISDVRKGSE